MKGFDTKIIPKARRNSGPEFVPSQCVTGYGCWNFSPVEMFSVVTVGQIWSNRNLWSKSGVNQRGINLVGISENGIASQKVRMYIWKSVQLLLV